MLSPSLEDYLEEIYRLSIKNSIRVSDIADSLSVSMPSVVKALKRLHDKEYLIYKPHDEITLTDKGEELGNYLVKRNSILREFLEIIGSKCNIADEAEAMEHYLSLPTMHSIEHMVDYFNNNPKIKEGFLNFVSKDTSL
ncbi:transcriptional regulator MntR [Oxobacter pfennigii]|uniref:Transcriptional regulator MntR n=1 Tax=Oxobacter pfennigii TaxID=36849 RepID=A0A0P9ABF1_9CLOT|nr:iron dependent repressor, metal binding and dimerization domain protein [Oxobacter pfennigii]KPU42391.1 transcriptional regulator MntR [Oxobacter pfennigii]